MESGYGVPRVFTESHWEEKDVLTEEEQRKLAKQLLHVESMKAGVWTILFLITGAAIIPAIIIMLAIARAVWGWSSMISEGNPWIR